MPPETLALDVAAALGAEAGITAGAGSAEAATVCAAGAAGATGDAPSTKVSVVPVGSETCWPVAAAATVAGALTWWPSPPSTEPIALAAFACAYCATAETVAELLVTATGWPLMVMDESCAA